MRVEAFGDESVSLQGDIALYSFVGFSPASIPAALEILRRAKTRFRVPAAAKLHCRVIFSKMQRDKSEWCVLRKDDPVKLCKYLSTELLPLKPLWSYGWLDRRKLKQFERPDVMTISFPGTPEAAGRDMSTPFGEKLAQRFAYMAAGIPFQQEFGEQVRFWVDRDSTQVEWFDKKAQAHNLDLLHKSSVDLPPEYAGMLEIADLFAYASARHLEKSERLGWLVFRAMHRRYGPKTSEVNLYGSMFGSGD